MSLEFTKVTATCGNRSTEFLTMGTPKERYELEGYTAFEDFMNTVPDESEVKVSCFPYTYGEGVPMTASIEEVAYLTMRMQGDQNFLDKRCSQGTPYKMDFYHGLGDRHVVQFGDEGLLLVPKQPIDCSKLGYFDSMEDRCWELIKEYADHLGIEVIRDGSGEEAINYDLAKRIQETIINEFMMAGVEFKFDENQIQINTDAVKEAIRNMNEDELFDENIFGYETIDEVFHYFYDEEVSKGEIVDKLTPSQKLDLVSEYMGDRILKFDGKFYVNNESFGSLDTDYYINGGHSGDISM